MAVTSKYALLNAGRLNAFRLNYLDAALKRQRDNRLQITLDGAPLKVRRGALEIRDVINDAPNTCSLTVDSATPPVVGQRLRVTLGVDPAYLVFVGTLQAARKTYVGRSTAPTLEWACEAIDDTARADWLRPFGAWTSVTATQVAIDILNQFAPGYTWEGVQLGLPPVTVYLDGTERINGALRLLAKLIGGYYYFEDYVLHLFQGDDTSTANPADLTGAPGQLLDDPPILMTSDDAQIRTRCYGKGHSEPTLADVNAGQTTIPIANAVMFNVQGGKAISEWQRLTYTGTVIGGDGALVGPGVTPSAAPALRIIAATGITPGAHTYAYTWVTAAGETRPSPGAAITVVGGSVGAPTDAFFNLGSGTAVGGPPAGTVMDYQIYITDPANPNFLSPPSARLRLTSTGYRPYIRLTTTPDMIGRYITVYRTDNNGQGWIAVAVQTGGNPGGSTATPFPPGYPIGQTLQWMDMTVNWTGGFANPPTGGNLQNPTAVEVSGVAIGPAGTTARRIYRSTANVTGPLKLVGLLGDNTSTAFGDTAPDANLGATAPSVDTSGLQMAAGQVLPGAAAIPVSSTAWARAAGGWAVIGNGQQVIAYSGISGNTITGIPPSGPGALAAAINYNSTISGAPMLLGVATVGAPSLATGLVRGAPINIWVQRDDTAAQSALAARVGGSGIVEQLIVDERRGEPSLNALCDADLARYSRPIVTVRYTCFDPRSRSGRPVRVAIPSLGIDQTLTIQDVTITHDGTIARFQVTASSVRTSLEDLLRRMVGTLEEGF